MRWGQKNEGASLKVFTITKFTAWNKKWTGKKARKTEIKSCNKLVTISENIMSE